MNYFTYNDDDDDDDDYERGGDDTGKSSHINPLLGRMLKTRT
jgi:hypothetical protein